ncbi:MAG: carboxypeptidase regulatory-like domain-containing protein [Terriglobia bacterium]
MPRKLMLLSLTILFCLAPFGCLRAQVSTATLTGEVTDTSNKIIPAAQVTVTNEATGVSHVVETNSVGIYSVPALPIGRYRIQVVKPGFRKSIHSGIELNVGQLVRVDFLLQLGEVTQTVTVVGATPLISPVTTSLGDWRYSQQIENLPLNARNISPLYSLTAGVPTYSSGVNPEVNGFVDNMGVGDVSFVVDGTVGNSPINSNSGNVPSLDGRVIEMDFPNLGSVEEFHINTADGSAENDDIATVSIVTKSGTNEFHGSAFEFNRTAALSARDFFLPNVTPLTRNQYGVNLGGPIRRDKTFFFVSWEGFRDHRSFPVAGKLPNEQERNGDLSELESKGIQLRNPLGGTFVDDIIPASQITSIAKTMLGTYVPLPAGNVSAFSPGAANFVGAKPEVDRTDKVDVKIDQHFSSKDSLTASYIYDPNFNDWTNDSPLPNQIGLGLQNTLGEHLSIAETHILSPTKLNVLRLGMWYKHRLVTIGNSSDNFLTGPNAIPGITPAPPFQGVPCVTLSSSLISVSPNLFSCSTTSRRATELTTQIGDNLTMQQGRHSLEFGANIERPTINNFSVGDPSGCFTFTSSPSVATSATGDSFADFLLGLPQSDAWQVAKDGYTGQWFYAFFAQDGFSITPRLRLNYGLRWDYFGRLSEKYGRNENIDLALGKVVVPAAGEKYFLPQFVNNPLIVTAGSVGLGGSLLHPDLDDWAPRIGLAYQPFGNAKTVIRAAYGIYYTPPSGFLNFQNSTDPPFNQAYTYSRETAIGAAGTPPSFANPVATGGVSSNLLAAAASINPYYEDLYSQVWNFTIERALGKSWRLRTSYIGNQGTNLWRKIFANGCLPGPIPCQARTATEQPARDPLFLPSAGGTDPVGTSVYNSLQVDALKRFGNGFFLDANYTWSKVISTTEDPEDPIGNANLDRGPYASSIASVFHVNGIWDLPFGANKRFARTGPAAKILGGWQLAGLATAQSGMPFDITAPASLSGTGSDNERASRIGSGFLPGSRPLSQQLNEWFNTADFVVPALGEIGNSGVGILNGPGLFDTDVSLMRMLPIHERLSLELRADFFNVFNNPNFGQPVANVTSSAFGRISSSNPNTFSREVQFGAQLRW